MQFAVTILNCDMPVAEQSIQKVKDAKKHMKDIWEESKTYRISDKIHMTEIQVLLSASFTQGLTRVPACS